MQGGEKDVVRTEKVSNALLTYSIDSRSPRAEQRIFFQRPGPGA